MQCKIDITVISEDGKIIQMSMKHFFILLLRNATKHNSIKFSAALLRNATKHNLIKFSAALLHVSSGKF